MPWSRHSYWRADQDRVEASVAKLARAGRASNVLVVFSSFYSHREREILRASEPEALDAKIDVLKNASLRNAEELGTSPHRASWLAGSVALRVGPRGVDDLARHPGVVRVLPNLLEEAPTPPRRHASRAPASSWGVERIGAPKLWERGLCGEGVLIGHIDTGVDAEHPDLVGKVTAFEAFDPWGKPLTGTPVHDSASHGTQTAGVLVGGGSSGRAIGVAPAARLLSAAALPQGAGSTRQVLAGLEWCVEQGARILSLSLGGSGYSEVYEAVLGNLERLGAFAVAAAGNDGLGVTGSPANLPGTCAVGAVDAYDRVAEFSGGGAFAWSADCVSVKPDLVAPGAAICTARPTAEAAELGGEPYETLDGTSLAAPHVAGVAALLWQAFPEAQAGEIRRAIYESCLQVGPAFHNMHSGRGLVRAPAALARLERMLR